MKSRKEVTKLWQQYQHIVDEYRKVQEAYERSQKLHDKLKSLAAMRELTETEQRDYESVASSLTFQADSLINLGIRKESAHSDVKNASVLPVAKVVSGSDKKKQVIVLVENENKKESYTLHIKYVKGKWIGIHPITRQEVEISLD